MVLDRIRFIAEKLRDIEEKLHDLEEDTRPSGIAYDGLKVQGGARSNPMDSYVIKREELIQRRKQLTEEKNNLLGTFSLIALSDRQREAVILYYMRALTITQVSRKMDISVTAARKLKAKGVRAMQCQTLIQSGAPDGQRTM